MEPANRDWLFMQSRRRRRAACLGLIGLVLLSFAPALWPAVLLLVGVPAIGSLVLSRRIRQRGLVCADCGATYEWGSAFFADRKANPRGIEPRAIPPGNFAYWERGETVAESPP